LQRFAAAGANHLSFEESHRLTKDAWDPNKSDEVGQDIVLLHGSDLIAWIEQNALK
jgi:hypothetical protein